jgi:hypothetical protein
MSRDILAVFPPELCLQLLSYLLCSDLMTMSILSRKWMDFMDIHSERIYREAAFQHHFIEEYAMSVDDTDVFSFSPQKRKFSKWKEFCECIINYCMFNLSEYRPIGVGAARCQLERNWLGEGNSTAKLTSLSSTGVWRIKIDEDEGIAIVSSTIGGISSLDLRAHHRPLWSIPEVYPFTLRPF